MRFRILALALLTSLSFSMSAQIEINSTHMPVANDSVKLNTASNVDQFDFTATGADFYWDFSTLEAVNFSYDGYVSVAESPALFQLVFNPFVSNLAGKRPDLDLMVVSIENGFNYYNNSAGKFEEVGFGAEINGIPLPVKYNSPDVIYSFPLSYQKSFNSESSYFVQVPTLGSLSQEKQRSTVVDGWGTIVTPYGSFECLRVASMVTQKDSVSLESLPLPLPAIPRTYTEYTWLSKKEHFPILKAVDNGLLGMEVTYIDSTNFFEELLDPEAELQYRLYPNPSTDYLVLETNQTSYTLEIFDVRGVRVFSKENNEGSKIVFDVSPLAAGVYIIKMQSEFHSETTKIIIH